MPTPDSDKLLEDQIAQWRGYLRRRQAIHSVDAAELEDHLREHVAVLVKAGLATDEAFLVAVKRMGDLDTISREFAREHSERLWKQLVVSGPDSTESQRRAGAKDAAVAFFLAVAAGAMVKLPALFGIPMDDGNEDFYLRNASLFVLPLLTGYFVWKRRLSASVIPWLAGAFVAAGSFVNLYPFAHQGSTFVLTVVHLPIALWLVVGVAYAGGRWRQAAGRMDFIRFSGELVIYYALIAIGGGLLTALLAGIFRSIGVNVETFLQTWWIPCCAAGAVVIASRLVEAKQGVIENMAPVLTRLFTPLVTAVLLTFLATLVFTGRGIDIKRDELILFDVLLALVLGLLLYSISARDPLAPPGAFDILQVVLVVSALVANAVALWAIAARINEFGFTPNRVAALGENVVLLANLAWSVVIYIRFLKGSGTFAALEKWQTAYVPVYSAWAAVVVIAFPPLFRFI